VFCNPESDSKLNWGSVKCDCKPSDFSRRQLDLRGKNRNYPTGSRLCRYLLELREKVFQKGYHRVRAESIPGEDRIV
jgi:hypothetical protein